MNLRRLNPARLWLLLAACKVCSGSGNGGAMVGIASTCRQPGHVALTFDSGPGIATGRVLDVLQRKGVPAAFHVTVDYFRNQTLRAYVQRAVREGHTIGVFVPDYMQSLASGGAGASAAEEDTDALHQSIARAHNWLTALIGRGPQYVRFARKMSHVPLGTKRLLESLGMMVTRPRVDVRDESNKLDGIWGSLLKGFNASAPAEHSFVVRLRDIMPNTAASLDRIIDYIVEQGYVLVPLETCVPLSARLVQLQQHKLRAVLGAHNQRQLSGRLQKGDALRVRSSPMLAVLLLLALVF